MYICTYTLYLYTIYKNSQKSTLKAVFWYKVASLYHPYTIIPKMAYPLQVSA